MKNKLLGSAIFGIASLGLSGCVVNIGHGDDDKSRSASWEKVQEANKANLNKLSLGMSHQQVLVLMGEPDFNEAYSQDSKEVRVLFFRTHHVKSDGKTTKDECTPVVFIDGVLAGWGEMAYSKI